MHTENNAGQCGTQSCSSETCGKCGKCDSCCNSHKNKGGLKVFPFAMAAGILWGLCFMMLAWMGWRFHHGMAMIALLAPMYKGFAATLMGGLAGAAWGFLKGFICGGIFAWLYNYFCCMWRKCCCKKPADKLTPLS